MPPHSITVLPGRHGQDGSLLEAEGRETRPQGACGTDFVCCILFLIAIVFLGLLGGLGFKNGNPDVMDRFLTGRDFKGRLCGIDAGVEDFKYAYYTVKLDSDPVGNTTDYWTPKTRSSLKAVCTNECPKANQTIRTMPVPQRSISGVCPPDMYEPTSWCTWYGADTFKLMNYCVDPHVFQVSIPWELWIEDLSAAAWHLASVLPVAIGVGFLFLNVLEKCGAVCVWVLVFLVAVIPAGLGVLVFYNAGNSSSAFEEKAKGAANLTPEYQQWIAYGLWGASGLVLLLMCCFAGTVRGVAAVVRTTSQFLQEVPSQMLQPIIFGIVHLVVIAIWLVAFIQVASIGAQERDGESCIAVGDLFCLKWDSNASSWGMLYMLLMIYWLLNFLHACSHFGTSFAVGAWYFTKPDSETGHKVPVEGGFSCCDVKLTVKALCYGLRRHAGSLAFGAFCISFAKICKLLLQWASKETMSTSTNSAVKCCVRCTNCIADCMERFIHFVSENAYVEMALTGRPFCGSAKEAMAMSIRRPGPFTLVGRVAFVVKLMGIALITSCGVWVVAFTLYWWKPERMHSMTVPLVAAGICALTVGEVMMHPFTAAARANLHCYCLDAAVHMEAEFTPQSMQRFVEDHEQHLSDGSKSCCGRCCPCF